MEVKMKKKIAMKITKKARRSIKQFLTLTLAALLTVLPSGCAKPGSGQGSLSGGSGSGETGNPDAKGRYVETQVDTPEDFSGKGVLKSLSDGSLELVDSAGGTKSISKDQGKTWETQTVEKLYDVLGGADPEVTSVALAEDGSIFFSYILWGEKEEGKLYAEKYVYQKPGKDAKEFELGIEDYKASVGASALTADGRAFVVMQGGGVYEIDLEKESAKQIFSLESEWDAGMCVTDGLLIIQDGSKGYFYNLESGEMTADDEVLNAYLDKQSQQKEGTVICSPKDTKDAKETKETKDTKDAEVGKTLYIAGCQGIAAHVLGGSVMEQLADGAVTNLGNPSKTPASMIQNEDGSFLILYHDGELDSYVYDAEASAVPKEQLVIYSLYDNETLRQAISIFRKENPDVLVRLEIGLGSENAMTQSDAVNNLNTELLAGEGPDMILLDGLPMESYVEKGMLLDLSGVAADLKANQGYFENILEGFQTEKGIYALVFRYKIPMISGNAKSISNISDLKTLADEAEKIAGLASTKETVLGTYTAEEVLEKLYLTSANVWVTDGGTIDRDALQEFLTQAKRIYEADQKNLDSDEKKMHEEMLGSTKNFLGGDERKLEAHMSSISLMMREMNGMQALTVGELSTMMDLETLASVSKANGDAYQVFHGQDRDVFLPAGMVGISANSKNQELAKKYISCLLSKEVQGKDLSDGLPVNKDAYKTFTTNPNPDSSIATGGEDKNGKSFIIDIKWPGRHEIEELKKAITSLKRPAVADNSMKNEIVSIGAQALRGEKGVDDSVEEIVQKITLHLTE